MIIEGMKELESVLNKFKDYNCVVIISKYNSGKSSLATEMIHQHFGEENTYYVTFVDQSKPHFTPRKSKLRLNEIVKDKVIVFDEIDADERIDVTSYLKLLMGLNLVIILTNPYGSSTDAEKEISLFTEQEKDILPERTLIVFVKEKIIT